MFHTIIGTTSDVPEISRARSMYGDLTASESPGATVLAAVGQTRAEKIGVSVEFTNLGTARVRLQGEWHGKRLENIFRIIVDVDLGVL